MKIFKKHALKIFNKISKSDISFVGAQTLGDHVMSRDSPLTRRFKHSLEIKHEWERKVKERWEREDQQKVVLA